MTSIAMKKRMRMTIVVMRKRVMILLILDIIQDLVAVFMNVQ